MDVLDQRVGLVRSDQLAIEVDGKTIAAKVKRALPKETDGSLTPGDIWIDYVL